jgi:hypothetical protein
MTSHHGHDHTPADSHGSIDPAIPHTHVQADTGDRRSIADLGLELSDSEKMILEIAINSAPGGQRPVATDATLGGFVARFAREALQAAVDTEKLTDPGLELARATLARLEKAGAA